MCALCTAVPTILTLGVAAESKQRQAGKVAAEEGRPLPRKRPYLALSIGGAVGLMAVSAAYHTLLRGG
jgi:hypothetical protein